MAIDRVIMEKTVLPLFLDCFYSIIFILAGTTASISLGCDENATSWRQWSAILTRLFDNFHMAVSLDIFIMTHMQLY